MKELEEYEDREREDKRKRGKRKLAQFNPRAGGKNEVI